MGKIKIDRSMPFDLVTFFGKNWAIEEEDKRALALTEVDFNNVRLEAMFKPGEATINGEERLKRLKRAKSIRLDAKILQTFWENQDLIPERWKEKTDGNTTYIFFDGTVLRDYYDRRFTTCLHWNEGKLFRGHGCLSSNFLAYNLSAVLVS